MRAGILVRCWDRDESEAVTGIYQGVDSDPDWPFVVTLQEPIGDYAIGDRCQFSNVEPINTQPGTKNE